MSTNLMPDTRFLITREARAWIGTPYHHGASVKGVGCDCLGLVRGVYQASGIRDQGSEPVYDAAGHWALGGERLLEGLRACLVERPVAAAEPGDVIAFRGAARLPVHHLGILTAPDRIVHVPRGRPAVEVTYGPPMRRRAVAAFAFPIPDTRSPIPGGA